jgi:cytochrome d ubiquinol oxidase subunit II
VTIYNSAASSYGLRVGLVWFGLGISLVIAYTIWVYMSFRGKVERVLFEEGYE